MPSISYIVVYIVVDGSNCPLLRMHEVANSHRLASGPHHHRHTHPLPVSVDRNTGVLWFWAEIMMVIIKDAKGEMQPAAQFQVVPAVLNIQGLDIYKGARDEGLCPSQDPSSGGGT